MHSFLLTGICWWSLSLQNRISTLIVRILGLKVCWFCRATSKKKNTCFPDLFVSYRFTPRVEFINALSAVYSKLSIHHYRTSPCFSFAFRYSVWYQLYQWLHSPRTGEVWQLLCFWIRSGHCWKRLHVCRLNNRCNVYSKWWRYLVTCGFIL